MAGQKQPINLVKAKGKKHLTKAEIAKREKEEVKAPSDKVRAPTYLTKPLKKEFNKISKELVKIGIMTNLDVDALARFVIAQHMYLEITKKIFDDYELLLDKDIVSAQDRFFKQCRTSAIDLGLTISSRCKLVLPEIKQKEPDNKFAKYGG